MSDARDDALDEPVEVLVALEKRWQQILGERRLAELAVRAS